MRALLLVLTLAMPIGFAQSSDEKDAIAAAQRVFEGIASHDGATLRSAMLPDARIYAVRDAGAPNTTAVEDMARQISENKSKLLERFTSPPKVLIQGRMAQVWGGVRISAG